MNNMQDPMYPYPGEGYYPHQKTFILMWNPAFSSVTMDYHLYCIEHFDDEPFDWNKSRGSKQIHYMDMQPNYIINPETMPIITTEQLQKAIPDFEWSKGHSGTLLTEDQAQKLEKLFADYLPTVTDKEDGVNLCLL